jgi:hypothetical protein
LRAFKKNKKNVQISIVGFGRPKFGGASTSASASAPSVTTSSAKLKTCPTCNQTIK